MATFKPAPEAIASMKQHIIECRGDYVLLAERFVLRNLTHYRHGFRFENDDILIIAAALQAVAEEEHENA